MGPINTTKQEFYRRYATRGNWHNFIRGLLDLKPGMRVLEVGCRNARLWWDNKSLPGNMEVFLTDNNGSTLMNACARLGGPKPPFHFVEMDMGQISRDIKEVGPFDLVIANHVMHLPGNFAHVVSGLHELTAPGGRFIASAHGIGDLAELEALATELAPTLKFRDTYAQFNEANGGERLVPPFASCEWHPFQGHLVIDNADDVLAFLLMSRSNITDVLRTEEERFAFRDGVAAKIRKNNVLTVSHNLGVFIAHH